MEAVRTREPLDTKVESLMDPGAPIVAPGVDQEVAAWRAVRHAESALAVVDRHAISWGSFRPTGWSRYSCRSMKKTCPAWVAS
jgi:hypothetical protein